MIDQRLVDRIETIANNKDWRTSFSEQGNKVIIEFENYTQFGQNLIVTIFIKEDSTIHDVAKSVYKYWESFDPDYEASFWIGSDGHGKNGAPYHISDIVEDMKNAQNMIEDLFIEISKG